VQGSAARIRVSSPIATKVPKLIVTQMYCVQPAELALGAVASTPVRGHPVTHVRPVLRALGELLIGVAERYRGGLV